MKRMRAAVRAAVGCAAMMAVAAADAAVEVYTYQFNGEGHYLGSPYDVGDRLIMDAYAEAAGDGVISWELGFDVRPSSGIQVTGLWSADPNGTRIENVVINLYRTSDTIFGPGVPRDFIGSARPDENGRLRFSFGDLSSSPDDGLFYVLDFTGDATGAARMGLVVKVTDAAGLVTAVPEPAPALLLTLGLGGMAWRLRPRTAGQRG